MLPVITDGAVGDATCVAVGGAAGIRLGGTIVTGRRSACFAVVGHIVKVSALIITMLWLSACPVHAAPAVTGPRLTRIAWESLYRPDARWTNTLEAAGDWRFSREFRVKYGVETGFDLAPADWSTLRFTAEGLYRVRGLSADFPGSLRVQADNTILRVGASLSPRISGLDFTIQSAYEHRWADKAESVYARYELEFRLLAKIKKKHLWHLGMAGAWLEYPWHESGNYLYFSCDTYLRYQLNPRATLKTSYEWSSYTYPYSSQDRSRHELAMDYRYKEGPLRFALGGELEYGLGRLSNHYLFEQGWSQFSLKTNYGEWSASLRMTGRQHLDPLTKAKDRVSGQLGAGYQVELGNISVKSLGFYECTLFGDGRVDWILGTLIGATWQPDKHWRITIQWAPEGNLSHDDKGLRFFVSWRP